MLRTLPATITAALLLLPWPAAAAETLLLLDERVVERTDRVALRVGTVAKHPANPLFGEDKPWEVRFDNLYPNLAFDAATGRYRCWYSTFIVDEATTATPPDRRAEVRYRATPTREMGLCHATSADGLRWEKPDLGLIEFAGSKANNLVMRSVHGAGVLEDAHASDPARRFKLFAGEQVPGRPRRFQVAFSADGLRWSAPLVCPEIGVEGDTHNNALWVPDRSRYVGITRQWVDGQRLVMRSESADFVRWSPAAEVLRGADPLQTYAMTIFPYGGVYLGLVMVIDQRSDRVHCELAWSPDSLAWRRIDAGRPLIPTADVPGAYDWGCVYAGTGPIVRDDAIRLYYGASNGPHTGWRAGFLALATLPRDRFAGYAAGDEEGVLVTRPVALAAARLTLNVAAPEGTVAIDVLDETGRPLPGVGGRLERVDGLHVAPRWEADHDPAALRERPVRLRFRLRRATLFAVHID